MSIETHPDHGRKFVDAQMLDDPKMTEFTRGSRSLLDDESVDAIHVETMEGEHLRLDVTKSDSSTRINANHAKRTCTRYLATDGREGYFVTVAAENEIDDPLVSVLRNPLTAEEGAYVDLVSLYEVRPAISF